MAIGITGTDVTKQTADMVLTDDNYASIVTAIEQGWIIYSNIRKFVYFLLACNVGEILIIFGAKLLGLPIPLKPLHLLWRCRRSSSLRGPRVVLQPAAPCV